MTDNALPADAKERATANPELSPASAQPPLPTGGEDLIAGGKVMGVFDHLAELRTRLVRSLVAVIALFFACFAFADPLINFLKQPLVAALPAGANALHFTGPLDVFIVQIKVALLTAVILACPIWLYQFWKFFEPALYPRERRYILPFIVASTSLFFAGISFCYFVMLPLTLDFLLQLGMEVGTPLITIKDYISLLVMLILGFGFVFEIPVLIVLLGLLDIVTAESLTTYRRFVVIGILVLAAVVTPPDPISQLSLAIPVYLMYELAIVLIRTVKRKTAPRSL